MTTNYLYLARTLSDPRMKKHNVYKVGCSTNPLERVRTLGGSGSTVTYEMVLTLELPTAVKDIHVLAHRLIDPFVVHRHTDIQTTYITLFGRGHANGSKRRREIVMFGDQYTLQRIKALFSRVVASMSSPSGTYQCMDENCIATRGASYCGVCTKFMKSLVNSITYQSGVSSQSGARKRTLADANSLFITMLEQTREQKRHKWKGPGIGDFWILRPDTNLLKTGCRFLVAHVQSRNVKKRRSRVQWWSCITSDVMDSMAKFTPDTDTDILSWDGGGWQCKIRTKHYNRFMRILDTDNVRYYARRWSVAAAQSNIF
jgi:hypothetical protein